MAITQGQLDTVLSAWRREYGYGGMQLGSANVMQTISDYGGSGGGRTLQVGTVADEFQQAWVQLSLGHPREYRMAMCLRGDVFAEPSDPVSLILERLHKHGVRMEQREFEDHVRWARAHFCETFTLRRDPA